MNIYSIGNSFAQRSSIRQHRHIGMPLRVVVPSSIWWLLYLCTLTSRSCKHPLTSVLTWILLMSLGVLSFTIFAELAMGKRKGTNHQHFKSRFTARTCHVCLLFFAPTCVNTHTHTHTVWLGECAVCLYWMRFSNKMFAPKIYRIRCVRW